MLDWLNSLEGKPWNLSLDRITDLLNKLGNPEKKLKCVHVAGTNGKGSVCAMLESILRSAGYTTGLYTSPHLRVFNERIQISGQMILDSELIQLLEEIKPHYSNQTHFEVITAAAFLHFHRKNVDIAVIETGLGGRLDATNVITPLISVITTISLEHTEFLGSTIEKIAHEKAGIIKKGVPVATLTKGSALKVIKRAAKEKKSKLILPLRVKKRGSSIKIGKHKDLFLNLLGDFQLDNAALAVAAIEQLPLNISEDAISQGLGSVTWPGRLEMHGPVVLDCAHNPEGIETLKKEVLKFPHRHIIGIVGILKDKDKHSMITTLSSFCDYFIFCEASTDRAYPAEELIKLTGTPCEIVKDVNKAIKKARKLADADDIILVTGSIYVVGEVRVTNLYKALENS